MMQILVVILVLFLALPAQTQAVCPVCTVAVASGLGLSRWLGIDDVVSSVWIGGLIISSGLWLADWITKKSWRIPFTELVSVVLMIFFIIPPLYLAKIIGLPNNTLWGIDKVILGTTIGSLIFLVSVGLDKVLRQTNDGKVYIYYQKVIIPVFLLTLVSFILFQITR